MVREAMMRLETLAREPIQEAILHMSRTNYPGVLKTIKSKSYVRAHQGEHYAVESGHRITLWRRNNTPVPTPVYYNVI